MKHTIIIEIDPKKNQIQHQNTDQLQIVKKLSSEQMSGKSTQIHGCSEI